MRIWFDVDGVLCNSIDLWIDDVSIRLNNGKPVCCDYWSNIVNTFGDEANAFWLKPDCYASVSAYADMQDLLDHLVHVDGLDIGIACFGFDSSRDSKIQFVHEHYPMISKEHVICCSERKYKYTQSGILVDDAFYNIIDHVMHWHKPGILFNYKQQYPHVKMFKRCCNTNLIRYADCTDSLAISIYESVDNIQRGKLDEDIPIYW